MEKLTENEIKTALHVLYLLEEMAWKKLPTEKAQTYNDKISIIESDIRHYNEIIEKEV